MKKSTMLLLQRCTHYIVGPLVILGCFYGAYWSYGSILKLEDMEVYEGKIAEAGIYAPNSRLDLFYLKMEGRPDTLRLWKLIQEYSYYTERMHKGDFVTAYVERRPDAGIFKNAMMQIEKEGEILFDLPGSPVISYFVVAFFLIFGLGTSFLIVFGKEKPWTNRLDEVATD